VTRTSAIAIVRNRIQRDDAALGSRFDGHSQIRRGGHLWPSNSRVYFSKCFSNGISSGTACMVRRPPAATTALRAGRRGDTSPLRGLGYANVAVCNVNAFAPSGLWRFRTGRVLAPLANANVLILCALFETVGIPISPPVGEQAKQDFTWRPSAERRPVEAGRLRVGTHLRENGASHVGFMDATQKKGFAEAVAWPVAGHSAQRGGVCAM